MPLERLLGYLEAVAGLLRSQPRCLSCRVPNHRSSQMAVPGVCGSRWRHLLQPLLSVLPLQMLSWLVIFFASGSPQAIGQRVTLSALRVTPSALRVTGWDPTCWGKMWDCKTSKMTQSPLAALNAFGLFAAGASGRARPRMCRAWRPPASRRRPPPRCSPIDRRRVGKDAGADHGTSPDCVLSS